MAERWLDITDIPAEGREIVFDDQEFWCEDLKEFHMELAPVKPLVARLTLLPQERGVLVRGTLEGSVRLACDRCAAPVEVPVSQEFDRLEEEPSPGEESLEPSLVRTRGHGMELDAGSMLWEEFVLALPAKPLCSEECKGLCPTCGQDLNAGPCGCEQGGLDPRMAALRGLTIAKK